MSEHRGFSTSAIGATCLLTDAALLATSFWYVQYFASVSTIFSPKRRDDRSREGGRREEGQREERRERERKREREIYIYIHTCRDRDRFSCSDVPRGRMQMLDRDYATCLERVG